MKVWILYKTDQWHSSDSRQMIGIFTMMSDFVTAMLRNGATWGQIRETIASGTNQSQASNKDYEFEMEVKEINEFEIV